MDAIDALGIDTMRPVQGLHTDISIYLMICLAMTAMFLVFPCRRAWVRWRRQQVLPLTLVISAPKQPSSPKLVGNSENPYLKLRNTNSEHLI